MTRKRKRYRVLLVMVILLATFCIWQYGLISYGLMQLRGQLRVINGAVSLEEFLNDPNTSSEARAKVNLVKEIRQFAFDSLGINYSDNYTTIFDQKEEPLMWVLTACEPYALEPKKWRFPFLGSFPYKGFFIKEKALEEAKVIREKEGLDVGVRTAGGWSTLGWFKDPVLSEMLNRSEGELASLIVHELTHGTLFVKDSVTFNENLATFIGDRGALMFLRSKYGKGSDEANAFKDELQDEETFKQYVLLSANRLDSLYQEIGELPEERKKILKSDLMSAIVNGLENVSFKSQRFEGYFDDYQPNNTFFMSFLRYNSQQDVFEKELENAFKGDLKKYLRYLKEKYPSL